MASGDTVLSILGNTIDTATIEDNGSTTVPHVVSFHFVHPENGAGSIKLSLLGDLPFHNGLLYDVIIKEH